MLSLQGDFAQAIVPIPQVTTFQDPYLQSIEAGAAPGPPSGESSSSSKKRRADTSSGDSPAASLNSTLSSPPQLSSFPATEPTLITPSVCGPAMKLHPTKESERRKTLSEAIDVRFLHLCLASSVSVAFAAIAVGGVWLGNFAFVIFAVIYTAALLQVRSFLQHSARQSDGNQGHASRTAGECRESAATARFVCCRHSLTS